MEQLEWRDLPSTVTWISPTGGDWSVGSNWSSGSVPAAGDDVIINQPGNITITHTQNVLDTINSLALGDTLTLSAGNLNAATIQNSGTLVVGSGTSVGVGSYVQSGGQTLLQGGTIGALRPPENTALSFSGTSQVQVPNTASLNPTTQVTVEAWINTNSASTTLQGIAGTWNDLTGNNRTYLLWIQSGKVAFYVSHDGSDFPSVVSTTTIQPGQWYHVAGTFDGTTLRLYVNGVEEASLVSPGPIATNTDPFNIGRVDGGGSIAQFFSGQISNVGVFNLARTQAQIQADMQQELTGSEVGLVGYWTLSSAGSGIVDKSANGNNGTASNPPPVAAPVAGGTVNIEGGTLSGSGTINADLVNAGEVDLGGAAGVLTVNGNYTQTAAGALALKVGGLTAGTQFDQLDVRDAASLGGTLAVTLSGGFNPLAGQVFDALNFGSESGSFATTNLPTSDGVTAFSTQLTANSLDLVGATIPPTSSVAALPVVSSPSFTVSWSGQDNPGGSGVASFDIYVSDNGGAFVPFLLGTTSTSAVFNGVRGHQYGFYSIATDGIGNREATPAAAEATTTVPSQVGTSTTVVSSVSPSVFGQPVTFTATISPVAPSTGTPTGTVTFLDGTTPLATVALVGGQASFVSATLGRGDHAITAVYNGDTSYLTSTSAAVTQQVRTTAIEPDPLDPSELALFVGGTSGDDLIEIDAEQGGKLIDVEIHEVFPQRFNFEGTFSASGLNRIVVYGGGGTNSVEVDHNVSLPVLVIGGTLNPLLASATGSTGSVGGGGGHAHGHDWASGALIGFTTGRDGIIDALSSLLAQTGGADGVVDALHGSHALDWLFAGVGDHTAGKWDH